MGLTPLSYLEIDAFSRLTLTDLTAWEIDLLMQIDDAVLETLQEQAAKPDGPSEVPVTDVAGLRAMFSNVPNRQVITP